MRFVKHLSSPARLFGHAGVIVILVLAVFPAQARLVQADLARVAVAPRPAVEPMQAPAAPKTSGRPLREAAQVPQPQTERPGASIDLDDVLSRRRA